MREHPKIDMEKGGAYRIICPKYIEAYRINTGHDSTGEVENLLGGKRVWTRVRFPCGHMIKINCQCLEKVE